MKAFLSDDKPGIAHLLFGVYIILLIATKFFFHEMWKDEWQAWQLATKTEDLAHLFSMLPGEGHPSSWFLLLRAWNGLTSIILPFTAEWFHLQLIHFLISAFVVFLAVYKVRSATWKKLLFLTSYFILYEYTVIARPYILLVLLSLLIVITVQKDYTSYRKIAILSLLVFLLTQVEVYGVFMAIGFAILIVSDLKAPDKRKLLLWPLLALAAGVMLFYLQVAPNHDTAVGEISRQESIFRKVADPFQSLTLNTFLPGFTNTVFKEEPGIVSLLLGSLLLYAVAAVFRKERLHLIAFLSVFALFLVFGVLFFLGGVRNWGLLYVFFLCLLLLTRFDFNDWKQYTVIALLFLFQFIHGANVLLSDLTGSFSNSKEAGEFIYSEIPDEVPVIGLNKAFCVPLTGYAGRPLIGMPEKKPYYFFEERDWRGQTYLPDMQELLLMKEHLRSKKIVVVYNKPLGQERFPLLKPLVKFDKPSLRNENYYFYYF